MKQQDEQAFVDFYQASYPRLVSYAITVVGERDSAEDIVQDAFIKAARRWRVVSELDNPFAWMRRVVLNASIDDLRGAHRRNRHGKPSAEQAVDDLYPSDEQIYIDAISMLAVEHRTVIGLRLIYDMTLIEIAKELDIPLGTVKSRLARAREHLRLFTAEVLDK